MTRFADRTGDSGDRSGRLPSRPTKISTVPGSVIRRRSRPGEGGAVGVQGEGDPDALADPVTTACTIGHDATAARRLISRRQVAPDCAREATR